MTLWWDDDSELAQFFDDSKGFAQTGTFASSSIAVIFDNAFAEDLNVKGSLPVATCRTADVTTLDEGDTITIDSTAYTVAEKKADGTGVTTLVLSSQ